MPDIAAHNALGDRVLGGLDAEISSQIDISVFRAAVMGPDPYLFYYFFVPPFRHKTNRRSAVMHRTKTGRFLTELARRSGSRDMFSYLAGFLCHYALDSTVHPFVYGAADDRADMHTAIEHKIDLMVLGRQGKQPRDIMALFPDYPEMPEVREAMKAVYGWDDDRVSTGWRHMKAFHWMTKDSRGVMRTLLGWMGGMPAALSYRTRLADRIDISVYDRLESEAAELGIRLVTAAYRYRSGEMGEDELREIIGNRSYAGGEAEDSRPL